MADTFQDIEGLVLTEPILRSLEAEGIHTPTAVQAQAMGPILSGRHVLMHSGTGTGKTLAYVLPVLQSLAQADGRAVIFAPGAELAMQILRVVDACRDEALSTAAAISTTSKRRQRKRVQRSTRLVVGTPDRLMELFKGGKLKRTRLIVLDEPDPILASRHAGFLHELLSRSEPRVQLVIASATLGPRIETFYERFMADGLRVEPADAPLVQAITHHLVRVTRGQAKEVVLARFVQDNRCSRAIVFVSEPRVQSHLFRYLGEHGLSSVMLSRERSKGERQHALDAFRSGKVRLLLVTDATARGIDLPEVRWVLHYDLPRSSQAYVHRAGRTGRAGHTGASVLFAETESLRVVRTLERDLELEFTTPPRRARRRP